MGVVIAGKCMRNGAGNCWTLPIFRTGFRTPLTGHGVRWGECPGIVRLMDSSYAGGQRFANLVTGPGGRPIAASVLGPPATHTPDARVRLRRPLRWA